LVTLLAKKAKALKCVALADEGIGNCGDDIQLNDNFSDLLNEGSPDVELVIGGNVNI
jgi:hypothetical protein